MRMSTDGAASLAATDDSPLRLYNTASRSKQALQLQVQGRVSMYSCGPTVYDYAHIGNFRAFLTYDVLKRWLMYRGLEVEHVCNLTDIDDKILARMQRDGVGLKDLTDKYAQLFFDDLQSLNIIPASLYPRATEHIDDMVAMIEGLIEKGKAYKTGGSVYFRSAEHSGYGTLAALDFEGMQSGAGEGGGEQFKGEKEDVRDFVLWKAYKPEDGEVFWDTRIGKGRPGWHIECSAMARRYLGDTIDIHCGGIDLVFPHHENEIAQTEGLTGKKFCNCWVHNGFVNVNNEKMSKSLGNFLTLKGSLKTALDVRAFRYLVVTSQHRMPLNFTPEALKGCKNTVKRLDKFRDALQACVDSSSQEGPDHSKAVEKALTQFEAGMDDDLNTPRAAAGLFMLVKAGEQAMKGGSLSSQGAQAMLEALHQVDKVFGMFYTPQAYEEEASTEQVLQEGDLPAELTALLEKRASAKAEKDWASADAVRGEITSLGYAVKDTKGGGVEVTRL
ncbi:unnamed protein product [Chrysoparadoxa australica]